MGVPFISIHMLSDRIDNIVKNFDSLEALTTDLSSFEIIINLIEQHTVISDYLDEETKRRPFTIKYIKTLTNSLDKVTKHVNDMLSSIDLNTYFIIFKSNALLFVTKGWDQIVKQSIGYYPDHLFRLQASQYGLKNHSNAWECAFAPTRTTFTTRKWLDATADWGPCLNTAAFQQCISYYLSTSYPFSSNQSNRDIPIPLLTIMEGTTSANLNNKCTERKTKLDVKAWYKLLCFTTQLEVKRRAALLNASQLIGENKLFDMVNNIQNMHIEIVNIETYKIEHTLDYSINKIKFNLISLMRAFNYKHYTDKNLYLKVVIKNRIKKIVFNLTKHFSTRRLTSLYIAMRGLLSPYSIIRAGKPNIINVTDESRFIVLLKNLGMIHKFAAYPPHFINKILRSKRNILFIKISHIEALTDPNVIVSEKILRLNKESDVLLVYDLSTEAIVLNEYFTEVLIKFHQILNTAGIAAKKVILLCANASAEIFYKQWSLKNNAQNYHIMMLGYDFYLYEYYWELSKCKWLRQNKTKLLSYSYETYHKNKMRKKHFICLNLRPRWHRTAVVLHLLERNYIQKGHLTYFGKEFADHHSVSTAEQTIERIMQLPSGKRLLAHYNRLNQIAPLSLDRDAEAIRSDLWRRSSGEVDFLIPEIKINNGEIDSYFEIVTETWLTDATASYITEKTIRPILRLQPFIHVGTPHLLSNLRKLGFKTFSPLINEDYDTIEDPTDRLEAIFKEIDRLCSMPLEEIHKIYCALWPILLFNYQHYFNRKFKYSIQNAGHDIFSTITNQLSKVQTHA